MLVVQCHTDVWPSDAAADGALDRFELRKSIKSGERLFSSEDIEGDIRFGWILSPRAAASNARISAVEVHDEFPPCRATVAD